MLIYWPGVMLHINQQKEKNWKLTSCYIDTETKLDGIISHVSYLLIITNEKRWSFRLMKFLSGIQLVTKFTKEHTVT